MKYVNDMTITELKNVPFKKESQKIGQFDSLVILPTRRMHDSGFRCMDFIVVREGKPLARLSGYSDVIHFDGISGRGKFDGSNFPEHLECKNWNIDCLPKSGLLQIFARDKLSCDSWIGSSFSIYSK